MANPGFSAVPPLPTRKDDHPPRTPSALERPERFAPKHPEIPTTTRREGTRLIFEVSEPGSAVVPPGSYLAVSHATPESFTDAAGKELLSKVYAETASGGATPRPKAEIGRFFNGLELTDPGVVSISAWRPASGDPATRTLFYGGVARKEG